MNNKTLKKISKTIRRDPQKMLEVLGVSYEDLTRRLLIPKRKKPIKKRKKK